MALRKSMAKNFLLLNYHAFVAIHTPIAVTFSTPTGDVTSLRRLFARQAKGKRKLVLRRCFANHPAIQAGKVMSLWSS